MKQHSDASVSLGGKHCCTIFNYQHAVPRTSIPPPTHTRSIEGN